MIIADWWSAGIIVPGGMILLGLVSLLVTRISDRRSPPAQHVKIFRDGKGRVVGVTRDGVEDFNTRPGNLVRFNQRDTVRIIDRPDLTGKFSDSPPDKYSEWLHDCEFMDLDALAEKWRGRAPKRTVTAKASECPIHCWPWVKFAESENCPECERELKLTAAHAKMDAAKKYLAAYTSLTPLEQEYLPKRFDLKAIMRGASDRIAAKIIARDTKP